MSFQFVFDLFTKLWDIYQYIVIAINASLGDIVETFILEVFDKTVEIPIDLTIMDILTPTVIFLFLALGILTAILNSAKVIIDIFT